MQSQNTPITKRHILIVDDAELNRALLKNIFEEDFDILEAADGEQALSLLMEHPDTVMVLLDLVMPIMDGFEVLDRMHEEPLLADIPVIVNSQLDKKGTEIRALEHGAADFITKPYNPAVIRQRVSNLIARDDQKRQAYEERLLNMQMRYKVEHDQLTGIYNMDKFAEATHEKLLADPDGSYRLIRWNIERFKVVNDLFGSDVGDRILCNVAACFASLIGENGTYGRIQADQFAACFPTSLMTPEEILHYIDDVLERFKLNYRVVSRIGVYDIDDVSVPVDQMCDRANLAMQTIRGNYIQRIAYYDESLRERMLLEQRIVSDMKASLDEEQFIVYLQPVYNVLNDEPMSAEALIRWNHPTMGMISPATFIPLFERNGFITQLDRYVWQKACEYMHEMDCRRLPPVPVSVNVSRMDFYTPSLCDDLVDLVESHGLERSRLRLEITESAYMENSELLMRRTAELQELGFKILMDDFGNGYSSLNMLKDIPVDMLKIDMKFMEGVTTSGRAGNVLMSVVRMAKWLDMSIIAEGVETQAQLNFLRNIGCDFVQGYYYSKPVPYAEFKKIIETAKPALVVDNFSDDTIDSFDFDSVWNIDLQTDLVFNDVIGGMGIYELYGDSLETLRVNSRYTEILGTEGSALFANAIGDESPIEVHSRALLLEACQKACNSGRIEHATIQRFHEDGHMMWLKVRIRYMGRRRGHAVLMLSFEDITERLLDEQLIEEQHSEIDRHHAFLENLYRTLPCGIITCSGSEDDVRIETVNPMALKMFGYEDDEDTFRTILEKSRSRLIYQEDQGYFQQVLHEVVSASKPHSCEVRIARRDGSIGLIRCQLQPTPSPDEERILQVVFMGITDASLIERRMNEDIDRSEMSEDEYLRHLLARKSYRGALFSDTLNILEYDPEHDTDATSIYQSDELMERYRLGYINPMMDIERIHPDDREIFTKMKMEGLTSAWGDDDLTDRHIRFRIRNNDNVYVWIEMVIRIVPENEGKCRYLIYIKPIDEKKKLEDEAAHDYLTGLLNRRAGTTRVDELCRESDELAAENGGVRAGEDFFIMFDIDDFKSVNDTYGHIAGDELLYDIARVLEDHFRKSDVVIRLGGDEFVIFAHGVADRDIVQKKLRDINKDLVALGRKRDWSIPVTTSMGVVISQRSGNTFQRLYALADEKLYDAKEAGKDCHMLVEDREDGVIISPISEMSRACPRDTRGQGVSDDA